jgi:hypothetical protein
MARPGILTLLICAAALLAGCGGDDDDGLPTGDVSRAAYIVQADRICAEGDKEIMAAARARFGTGEPSDEELAAFVEETVIASIQSQINQLRELEAPEVDADRLEAIYDTAQENLDESEPRDYVGDGRPFAEANRLARAYGFDDCGS